MNVGILSIQIGKSIANISKRPHLYRHRNIQEMGLIIVLNEVNKEVNDKGLSKKVHKGILYSRSKESQKTKSVVVL